MDELEDKKNNLPNLLVFTFIHTLEQIYFKQLFSIFIKVFKTIKIIFVSWFDRGLN